ncbi:MAG: DEAD/DEAH box helicase, partial [Patescibacteria group bacterium]|nr:DEAD/DEAH box helicase [Patescibacteria group bacterium]
MNLHQYQVETNRAVWRKFRDGCKSVLLQAPTGSGKTVMGAHLIKMWREHASCTSIVFAHRREIVTQTASKLEMAGLTPEIIMAGFAPNPWANVKVASIDTVWAAHKRGASFPMADRVVIDECHRTTGRYVHVLEHYLKQSATVLGLTATPIRTDGAGLGDHYQEMVCAPSTRWLIDNGYLAPVEYCLGVIPNTKGVKLSGHDFNQEQLQQVMDQKALIGDIVENWLKHAEGRSTMLFASGIKHSKHLVEQFEAHGIPAVHVDGDTPPEERDSIYARSQSGEVKVVCNDSVYVEGTDFPWISCLVDAHPTKSLTRYLQSGGRGLRTFAGKSNLLYLDHANNVYHHGRLESDREWEL